MSHNRQRKIALFNDITGFGKCSVTVQLPIISAMGLQCCPVPTAILSNHTAYDEYFFEDYTGNMRSYLDMWKKLDLKFEGVVSGFLGSESQIEIVKTFTSDFLKENAVVVVDPIMGDDGVPYKTYTKRMCQRMKELVALADVITPNVTEACILTDTPYKTAWTMSQLYEMAEKLSGLGPRFVVITGIETKEMLGNYVYVRDVCHTMVRSKKVGVIRCGTGDVFSSLIAADAVNGVDFLQSVKKATAFVSECLKETQRLQMESEDGVAFEDILYKLGK